jgi:hypothetical protein
MLLAGCAGGGGPRGEAGQETSAGPSASPSPSPSAAAERLYDEPADACRQIPSAAAKRLDITQRSRSSTADCRFDLGDDKYESTTIRVQYEQHRTVEQARTTYTIHKRLDFSGTGINTKLKARGDMAGVGGMREGHDYDEAHYTYAVVEMAGLAQGWLYTTYRRGNIVVEIDVSGQRVVPPYTGVLRSKPHPHARLHRVLEVAAAALLTAARPA